MGILQSTRCYLSGHMEYIEGTEWRNWVKKTLAPTGIRFFDPYEKPFITSLPETQEIRDMMKEKRASNLAEVGEYFRHVRSDDLRLCDLSDFSIVHIYPKVASWGTAEELFTLNRMKKPIFVAVEGGRSETPLWLTGTLKPQYFYNSVEEIVSTILKIDSGEIKIDSERWRLLKPELR